MFTCRRRERRNHFLTIALFFIHRVVFVFCLLFEDILMPLLIEQNKLNDEENVGRV